MIVDEHSQKFLYAVLKHNDILDEKVLGKLSLGCLTGRGLFSFIAFQVVETITSHREQQDSMNALYLIMPTSENVDRVIRDFDGGLYSGAYVYFIDGAQC